MSGPLIAVADSVFPDLLPTAGVLAEIGATIELAASPDAADILAVAAGADGLMVTFATIDRATIEAMPNCKVIGRYGIGVDNIDIEAATEAGIQVCFVPDYCLDEVSDHAMALLLSLARKVPFGNRLVQGGQWNAADVAPIRRLRGRTFGLVGLGKIPQALIPKARAFGLSVIAFDPYMSAEMAAGLGVELVSFEDLLAGADYISIHAPLTDETRNLFSTDAFRRMKPEALLINTARGPLVDEAALAAALDAGEIAGAALDVVSTEPPAADMPLLGRDNVILTPHTAFYSVDALNDLQTKAARDVLAVLNGKPPVYPVNKPAKG